MSIKAIAVECLEEIQGRNSKQSLINVGILLGSSVCAYFEPGDPEHYISGSLAYAGLLVAISAVKKNDAQPSNLELFNSILDEKNLPWPSIG